MDKNPEIIKKVVLSMKGTIKEINRSRHLFEVSLDGKTFLLERKIVISDNVFSSAKFTRSKDITYDLLKKQGLSTPKTVCFLESDFKPKIAVEELRKLKYPVIAKQTDGSNSRGIFPSLQNEKEVLAVLRKYLKQYKRILVQEMVFGTEYRLLVLDKKIIAALEMIPPHIVGNGKDTVRLLLRAKSELLGKSIIDAKTKSLLAEQQVALSDVLAKDRVVFFRANSSLADGGQTRDVTALVHPEVKKLAVSAASAVGRKLSGIDVICDDISRAPNKKNFHILEINGKPDLYIHYNPDQGQTRDVIKIILTYMVKNS